MATVLTSNRGGQKLESGGFVYNFEKKSRFNDDLFYNCELVKKNRCRARIHVRNGRVMKNVGHHNHAPDGQRKQVIQVSILNHISLALKQDIDFDLYN